MARLNFSIRDDKPPRKNDESWKILVVDDDISVHQMTKILMENWLFLDRPVTLLNAHSEKEAREMIASRDDIALVFMDVIMERDDSGFRLVEFLRNELHNKFTRVVLRTGQPGRLSIREVVQKYDINDYREKTQLSVDVLYTVTSSCLRAYHDLKQMELSRRLTEVFFNEYASLFPVDSLETLAGQVLRQIRSTLKLSGEIGLVQSHQIINQTELAPEVLSWIGEDGRNRKSGYKELPSGIRDTIEKVFTVHENHISSNGAFLLFKINPLVKNILYFQPGAGFGNLEKEALSVYLRNLQPLFSGFIQSDSGDAGRVSGSFPPFIPG